MNQPAYLVLFQRGQLEERVKAAYRRLAACDLCPHRCRVNRLQGEQGICHTGREAVVASAGPHYGEERPLVGHRGSGTIFFSWCNLGCLYCQNHELSHFGEGEIMAPEQIASLMLGLQRQGCHNINLVSPSHVVPQILSAVQIAAGRGLRLPLVYNTGGYDSLETLALLDGVVDIYMPDMKYADVAVALRYSGVRNYPAVNQAAVQEMFRQVGDLVVHEGVAVRGLLVRHLVLPEGLAGTAEIIRFLADLSSQTYLNLMDQYRPCFKAQSLPPLNRRITRQEYQAALRFAQQAGLQRLDDRIQRRV